MSNSTYSLAPWLRPGRALAAAGLVTALAACGGSGSPAPAGHTGTPAAAGSTAPAGGTGQTPAGCQAPDPAESNPPGDIPDTTVYVPYQSAPGHLLLKVPEGWLGGTALSRAVGSDNVDPGRRVSQSLRWM